ncbi:hypothetical protein [Streptomyces sp. NPDC058595]|uniref:hypothetical protein n=1 Tax=Streptomyces sp. NPDC058595 TaxID=3346550 RepID=UPI0036611E66
MTRAPRGHVSSKTSRVPKPLRPLRAPWLLGALAVLCAWAGYLLLAGADGPVLPGRPAAAPPTAPRTTGSPLPTGASPAGAGHPATSATSTPAVVPPAGQGPDGDPYIQRLLEEEWPADLPAADERQLTELGTALLRADATGTDRSRFPAQFPQHGATAPAFSHFRVQAVVARRDENTSGRAVVHLVWAGTDRGGTHADGRITDLYFTRTQAKGNLTWTPLR